MFGSMQEVDRELQNNISADFADAFTGLPSKSIFSILLTLILLLKEDPTFCCFGCHCFTFKNYTARNPFQQQKKNTA